MRQAFTILTLFILSALTANAKLIMIHIEKSLAQAKHIQTIVVYGYSDSTMLYGILGTKDTLTIVSNISKTSEQFRLTLIDKKVIKKTDLSGKWPETGDTVLVLINDRNKVELFAKKIKDRFRFWDPNSIPFANSFFQLKKEPPFYLLKTASLNSTQGQTINIGFVGMVA